MKFGKLARLLEILGRRWFLNIAFFILFFLPLALSARLPKGLAVMAVADKFPDVNKITVDFLRQNSDFIFFSSGEIMASYMTLRVGASGNEQVVERARLERCDKESFYCDSVNRRMFEVTLVSESPTLSIYNFKHIDERGLTVVVYRVAFIRNLDLLLPLYASFKSPFTLGELGYPHTQALKTSEQISLRAKFAGGLLYNMPMLNSDVIGRVNIGQSARIIAVANDPVSKVFWFYVVLENLQGFTFSQIFEPSEIKTLSELEKK